MKWIFKTKAQYFFALTFGLIFISQSLQVWASNSQDIVGNWKMTKQYCSNGGDPALMMDGMKLKLDGKNIWAQIESDGCQIEMSTPYVDQNQSVEFEVSKLTQICPGKTEVIDLTPQKGSFPYTVNQNKLLVEARVSILEGLCPNNGIIMVDFDRE